jgi:hypothetical protein
MGTFSMAEMARWRAENRPPVPTQQARSRLTTLDPTISLPRGPAQRQRSSVQVTHDEQSPYGHGTALWSKHDDDASPEE